MINVLQAASYIFHRYQKEYNSTIDEMKLHKLLYFAQRESLIMFREPMFNADFEAWKYGPVLVAIRDCYKKKLFIEELNEQELAKFEPVFDEVFTRYAGRSSWSLSNLSHNETSWRRARVGLSDYDKGSTIIPIDHIREDAERMRLNRFLFEQVKPQANRENQA